MFPDASFTNDQQHILTEISICSYKERRRYQALLLVTSVHSELRDLQPSAIVGFSNSSGHNFNYPSFATEEEDLDTGIQYGVESTKTFSRHMKYGGKPKKGSSV